MTDCRLEEKLEAVLVRYGTPLLLDSKTDRGDFASDLATAVREYLLSDDERGALAASAELARRGRLVIGSVGSQVVEDWNEMAVRILDVQMMILRNVAARAFPDEFRLLGQSIGDA